jgi:hypothetical protein
VVLVFTLGVSMTTGILFGVAPVWRAIKVDLNTSLKAGGRSGQSDGGLHLRRHSLRGLLIVSELTLSLMLLIGAGLLIRSFQRLQNVSPEFTTDRVLAMEVAAAGRKYQDDKNDKPIINFYEQIESRVAHLPGVVAEGMVSALPMTGEAGNHQRGRVHPSARAGVASEYSRRKHGLFSDDGDSAAQGPIFHRR